MNNGGVVCYLGIWGVYEHFRMVLRRRSNIYIIDI